MFDYIIEKQFNAYIDTNLPELLQLENIPSDGSQLLLNQQLQLAKAQSRDFSANGRLNSPSMVEMAYNAFYANKMKH